MSVFGLQLLAMITMFCDHFGSAFLDNNLFFRCIGRFAFAIYAFLIAEGFRHIKDDSSRVSSHLGWLVVLAVVSEPCYDLLEFNSFNAKDLASSQNAIITLLLGFLGLMAIQKWQDKPLFKYSAILLTAGANYLIFSNYKFVGVLLIYAFYVYLERFVNASYFKKFGILLAIFVLYLPLYHWARYDFCGASTFISKLEGSNTFWYITHIFVAMLLASYEGILGFYSKKFKLIYKGFYPAHLLILGLIYRIF